MSMKFEKHLPVIIERLFQLMGKIPRNIAVRAGCFLGKTFWVLDRKHRHVAWENLSYAYQNTKSPQEIRKITRCVFENLGQILFEIGWALHLNRRDFSKYFHVSGMSHIINAYKKGRGVLVLTAHVGNWELLTIVAAMTGCPTSIVVRPLDFGPLESFFSRGLELLLRLSFSHFSSGTQCQLYTLPCMLKVSFYFDSILFLIIPFLLNLLPEASFPLQSY